MRRPKSPCLTAFAWNKPQTHTLRGFRLMPVLHSVKAWSKWLASGEGIPIPLSLSTHRVDSYTECHFLHAGT